jgi:hypothetical protein
MAPKEPQQELILHTHEQPTLWNKSMAIGALAGNLLGGILGGWLGGTGGVLIGRMIGIIGLGLAGGWGRKQEMKEELVKGKRVTTPTAWNKDTALGALLGIFTGGVLSGILAKSILLATATAGLTVDPDLAFNLMATVMTSLVGGGLIGGIVGGMHGKERMAKEYREAEQQLILAQQVEAPQMAKAQAQEVQVTAPTRTFREQVELERAKAAQQRMI